MRPRNRGICVVRHGYFPSDPRVRKAVSALLESGYEVDVVCLRNEGEARHDEWNGARITRLAGPRRRAGLVRYLMEYLGFFVRAGARIAGRTLRRPYALVQVHTMPDFLAFVALVPKLFGTKLLLDFHELMPEFFAVKFGRGPRSLPVRAIALQERVAAKLADRVLGVSPIHAETVAPRIGKPITVVPNVPDTGVFESLEASSVQGNGRSDPPTVITHGTLVEAYGVQVLVEAVAHLVARRPIRLQILGDGEYLDELRALVGRLALEKHVEFLGRVPLEDVAGHIRAAEMGVVAFLADGYMEFGVPNKLFEYVALRRPVVAPDLRGIRSYFDDRQITFFEAGNATDLADKIESLLDQPERGAATVAAAEDVYDELNWDKTKAVYLSVVNELAGPSARARVDQRPS